MGSPTLVQRSSRLLLKESILLAGLTALAHYCAYRYEVGYYRAFAAPEELISIGLSTLLIAASVLGGAAVTAYWYLEPVASWVLRPVHTARAPKVRVLLSVLLLFALQWCVMAGLYNGSWRATAAWSGPATAALLLLVYLGMEWALADLPELKRTTYRTIPAWLLLGGALIAATTSLCQGFGHQAATRQRRFTVIANAAGLCAIRRVDGALLCVSYDTTSHVLTGTARLVGLNESGLLLSQRAIGPLKLPP